jgi:hypothetical protein
MINGLMNYSTPVCSNLDHCSSQLIPTEDGMFLYFAFRISRLDIGNTSYLITNVMPAIHALAISAVLVATTVKA